LAAAETLATAAAAAAAAAAAGVSPKATGQHSPAAAVELAAAA
jgi:hypothetical protein